jgi:RHS repeat-associated protein
VKRRRCVKRWVGPSSTATTATYFYYDGWNLIQEGTGAAAAERIYLLGNGVDRIVCHYNYAHTRWRYHHYDARGHCILVTDPNGTLVEQYEYDAFGRPYFYNASNGWTSDIGDSAFGNRFLFTGREWLSDLKLYDYRNRMYQPELGRFVQPDPKQFEAGDYNLYRYCHNDPVNKSDPFGLFDVGFEGYGAPSLTGGTKDTVGNVALRRFIGSEGMFSRTQSGQQLALSAIRNAVAKSPNEPIRIFGYSRGAKAANDTARRAGAEGIKIRHEVLIDPVSILGQPQSLKIPPNVERADNYYQKSGGPFRGGPAANPSSTVVNTDVSGSGIDHNTIVAQALEIHYVTPLGSHIPEPRFR